MRASAPISAAALAMLVVALAAIPAAVAQRADRSRTRPPTPGTSCPRGPDPGDAAATGRAAEAERAIRALERTRVAPGRAPTLEAYVADVSSRLDRLAASASHVAAMLDEVRASGGLCWDVAADVQAARAYEIAAGAAVSVLVAPASLPADVERRLRGAPTGSRDDARAEVEARLREALEARARSLECLAIAHQLRATRRARDELVDDAATDLAVDRLAAHEESEIAECLGSSIASPLGLAPLVPGETRRATRGALELEDLLDPVPTERARLPGELASRSAPEIVARIAELDAELVARPDDAAIAHALAELAALGEGGTAAARRLQTRRHAASEPARLEAASLLVALGRPADAVALLRARATSPASRIALARAALRAGDLELARSTIAGLPDGPEAALAATLAAHAGGRYAEEVATLRAARARDPESSIVAAALALRLARSGRHDEALALLDGLGPASAGDPRFLVIRSEALRGTSARAGDAIAAATAAEQASPLFAAASLELALGWIEGGPRVDGTTPYEALSRARDALIRYHRARGDRRPTDPGGARTMALLDRVRRIVEDRPRRRE